MRLADEEFWKMLPVNYFAIYAEYEVDLEQRDFMAAQICCTVANAFRGKGKACKVADFMKFSRKKKPKQAKQKQSMEEQMAIAKAITVAFGGAILEKKPKK